MYVFLWYSNKIVMLMFYNHLHIYISYILIRSLGYLFSFEQLLPVIKKAWPNMIEQIILSNFFECLGIPLINNTIIYIVHRQCFIKMQLSHASDQLFIIFHITTDSLLKIRSTSNLWGHELNQVGLEIIEE